jgi:transcriptional repressor NF-X1
LEASFDDLECTCGKSVIYAPVSCGITILPCLFECVVTRECEHRSDHHCHEGECPGCTAVVDVGCIGHGNVIKGVCGKSTGVSCGKPCGKKLGCAGYGSFLIWIGNIRAI